jgi:hypothetical protein
MSKTARNIVLVVLAALVLLTALAVFWESTVRRGPPRSSRRITRSYR